MGKEESGGIERETPRAFGSLEEAREWGRRTRGLREDLERLEAARLCLELEDIFGKEGKLEGVWLRQDYEQPLSGLADFGDEGQSREAERWEGAGRHRLEDAVERFRRYAPDLLGELADRLEEDDGVWVGRGNAGEIARSLGLAELGAELEASRIREAAEAAPRKAKPRRM